MQHIVMQGNVEVWLGDLLRVTLKSVHGIIRQSSMIIQDPAFKLIEFENSFAAQVCGYGCAYLLRSPNVEQMPETSSL